MKRYASLLVIALIAILCTGCNPLTLNLSEPDETPERFVVIEGQDSLYYDIETKIVYVIFSNSKYVGNNCGVESGYMSAYIAPNGLPYKYDDGTLVEIEFPKNEVIYNVTTLTTERVGVVDDDTYMSQGETEVTEMSDVCALPEHDMSFKAYMDYRTITDTTTEQWKLQQQSWTDWQGLRRFNTDYCVAMGTGYAEEVGDRFQITLDTGSVFTVIVADIKSDTHTDRTCRFTKVKGNMVNVLEFIVDENALSNEVLTLGTVGHYDNLSGNIVAIERISD